jgi:hypothetical protein
MLIGAGHPDAVSFNDVGSPDGRQTAGLKVHINAQVVRVGKLNWYYKLLQLCPDIPGELKSAVVLARFDALPTIRKTEIWTTLGKVAIHVVDPRPYKTSVDSLLRRAMKREDAPEYLRQSASEGFVWARNLHLRTQVFAAESILGDSIASRAHRLSHAFGQDAFIMPFERVEPPELVTVQDFKCDPKGVVRKVTEWSAKAAAAFHASMDALDTFAADDGIYRFDYGQHIRRKMMRPLTDTHAFDKGDDQQMRVLEDVRGKLIESMTDPNDMFSRMQRMRGPIQKYVEFDSKDTLFGQAADIAAGIASAYFEREGITGIVSRFEHVTYNGKRTRHADIAKIMHDLSRG